MTPITQIETATLIGTPPGDPWKILVGLSKKHPHRVLPGGKLEGAEPPERAVRRETEEEIKARILMLYRLGVARDPRRDIRETTVGKLRTAAIRPSLRELGLQNLPDDYQLDASFGTPDHLFVGTLEFLREETSDLELTGREFLDVRDIRPGSLSAGHDVVAIWYRYFLETKKLPPDSALCDFVADRGWLAGYFDFEL